jgi:hypothetical protein
MKNMLIGVSALLIAGAAQTATSQTTAPPAATPKAAPAATAAPKAAPAPPAAKELKPNCDKTCVVTVMVPAGCGSGIAVAPDPIVVAKGKSVDIQWKIIGDWKFDENGIYVHQGEEAFDRGKGGGSATFVIKHVNKKRATYKYDVNLVGKDGAKCSRDPTVVND